MSHRPRGFTLLELAAVIAIIGILSSLAAPVLVVAVRRSRATEARSLLESIADAELQYWRDHGKYLACPPSPAAVPHGSALWSGGAAWEQLGMRVVGPVAYQYAVELDGASFKVLASGDLDSDGKRSAYALDGKTLELTATDELE